MNLATIPYSRIIIISLFFVLWSCITTQTKQNQNNLGRFNGPQISCSNLLIFVCSQDQNSYLKISLDATSGNLSLVNEFEVNDSEVEITEVVYNQKITSMLCNDVRLAKSPKPVRVNKAQSAAVQIIMDDQNFSRYKSGKPYKIDVIIDKLVLDSAEPPFSFTLTGLEVGWLPG